MAAHGSCRRCFDVPLLRRTLPIVDHGKFLGVISLAAGVISLLSPGMLVMI